MKPIFRASLVVLALTAAACGTDRTVVLPGGPASVEPGRASSFDGEVLRLALAREDGSRERFNSVRDEAATWPWLPVIPGHAGRRRALVKSSTDKTSVVYALVSWSNNDATDYLAAGYWLDFPNNAERYWHFDFAETTLHPAFVDGPELDPSSPPAMPSSGTASYTGSVGGLFTYGYGSTWDAADAPVVTEEFQAAITMTADFADSSLSACIGCVGDIKLTRDHLYAALGIAFGFRRPEPLALPTDYELHFAGTPIRADGTFEGVDVEVRHPERTVAGAEGRWSGRFSSTADPHGNPRLTAGMADVAFGETDGSTGKFTAIYTALAESLAPSDRGAAAGR